MDSIWLEKVQRPAFQRQENDIKTDVLIIGGGMAGLLCAHMLQQAGVDYTLVEAGRICDGITKNTTAKITFQHGLIYHQIIRRFGLEAARLYWKANQTALEKYEALCSKIDCDFQKADSAVYSLKNIRVIEKEAEALEKIGVASEMVRELPLPLAVAGAVRISDQAQFHPLKFAFSIAKDLNIYEHTRVVELGPRGATANGRRIQAEIIIVSTHFPFLNKHGGYFFKLYQHRSYVIALKNAEICPGMYVDEAENGLSFRSYNDLLLLGGGSHRTGKTGGNWKELMDFAWEHHPKAQVVGRWATQDCMSLDGIPYIGPYSKHTPRLYVAAGFNKWGMSSAMAAAMILRDMVQGKKNPWQEVFSPARTVFHSQLAINIGETALNMLTPTRPRCPHMGCALKYNPQEHSWDCSCHGSRFTQEGKLLDNPANGDQKEVIK